MNKGKIIALISVIVVLGAGTTGYIAYKNTQNDNKIKQEILLTNKYIDNNNLSKAKTELNEIPKTNSSYNNLNKNITNEEAFNENITKINNYLKDNDITNATNLYSNLTKESNLNSVEKETLKTEKSDINNSMKSATSAFNSEINEITDDLKNGNLNEVNSGIKNLENNPNFKILENYNSKLEDLKTNITNYEKENLNKVNKNNAVAYLNKYLANYNMEAITISSTMSNTLEMQISGNYSTQVNNLLKKLAIKYPNKSLMAVQQVEQISIDNQKAYVIVLRDIPSGYAAVVGNLPFVIIGANGHIYTTTEIGEAFLNNTLKWNKNICVGEEPFPLAISNTGTLGKNVLSKAINLFEKTGSTASGNECYLIPPNGFNSTESENQTINQVVNSFETQSNGENSTGVSSQTADSNSNNTPNSNSTTANNASSNTNINNSTINS